MGRDLLAQDYMLKQITASLIYPEDEIGKKFWKRIYEEAAKRFKTTNISVNTFNKVWIVPEKAVVYENAKAGTAYVVESRLKVMLEQDYLAFEKDKVTREAESKKQKETTSSHFSHLASYGTLTTQIVKEVIIPVLTKEINEGKNFAQLRQVYNSLILAQWYKKKIKNSILNQVYADKNKISALGGSVSGGKGILTVNKIYEKYLMAFKKGAYNYIKDTDMPNGISGPRKYFSGGANLAMIIGESLEIESSNINLPNNRGINMKVIIVDMAVLAKENRMLGKMLRDRLNELVNAESNLWKGPSTLAKKINRSKAHISQILNSTRSVIGIELLSKILTALKVESPERKKFLRQREIDDGNSIKEEEDEIRSILMWARIDKEWSIRTLAKKVGINSQTIFRYEHGDRTPSRDVMIKLAEVLGITGKIGAFIDTASEYPLKNKTVVNDSSDLLVNVTISINGINHSVQARNILSALEAWARREEVLGNEKKISYLVDPLRRGVLKITINGEAASVDWHIEEGDVIQIGATAIEKNVVNRNHRNGGVDLTSDKALRIKKDGLNSLNLKIDPAMLKQFEEAGGFTLVIKGVRDLTDLRSFLLNSNLDHGIL